MERELFRPVGSGAGQAAGQGHPARAVHPGLRDHPRPVDQRADKLHQERQERHQAVVPGQLSCLVLF